MTMTPYNHKYGQLITTDADNVSCDRALLSHFHIAAADAVAAAVAAVLALSELTVATSVIAGLTSPVVPRNVQVVATSALTTKVKVYGTNYEDEVISEELTLNGLTAVKGTLAFKTITKVDLPAKTNTKAKQKTTSGITTAATKAGTITVTVTAAAIAGGHTKDVDVVLAAGDTTKTNTAIAIAAALQADATVGPLFTCAQTGEAVTMEAKAYRAQDATINLVVKTDTDSVGVVLGAITINTVTGVIADEVSVGWADSFGLPYLLPADELAIVKLFNNAADTGTVTADATDIEKNIFTLNGTADGLKDIDVYIIV